MVGVRKDVFKELENVRRLVSERFPDFDMRNLCVLLGRLGTYHYNRKRSVILGMERRMYDLLIENSYNPYTVYRWALLERVPDEIKFQLRNHFLSQKKASKLFFERRHETDTTLQVDIRQLGLQIIKEM